MLDIWRDWWGLPKDIIEQVCPLFPLHSLDWLGWRPASDRILDRLVRTLAQVAAEREGKRESKDASALLDGKIGEVRVAPLMCLRTCLLIACVVVAAATGPSPGVRRRNEPHGRRACRTERQVSSMNPFSRILICFAERAWLGAVVSKQSASGAAKQGGRSV